MSDPGSVSEIPPFTLQRFLGVLKARWHVAMAIVLACFFACVVYLHFAPARYTIAMQVVAAQNDQMSAQSYVGSTMALFSKFGGSQGSDQNNLELYLANLQSIETARVLAQDPAFMHRMFASEWSDSEKKWRRPFSLSGAVLGMAKGVLGIYVTPWNPPDAVRVLEFLQSSIAVERSITSPVVVVSVQTSDRQYGVDLMNMLHNTADGILRRRALERETDYIGYLNGLIEKATIVEYRQALAETIVQQEKVRMVAASGAPYAADLFARPTVSRAPTSPNGLQILLMSVIVGIFFALAEVVIRDRFGVYWRFLGWPTRWHRREAQYAVQRRSSVE